jgi:hypothetical protein
MEDSQPSLVHIHTQHAHCQQLWCQLRQLHTPQETSDSQQRERRCSSWGVQPASSCTLAVLRCLILLFHWSWGPRCKLQQA